MPGPSSHTSSRRPAGSAARASTDTRPPVGLCRIALSTRLTTTCRRRAGSATATSSTRRHRRPRSGRRRPTPRRARSLRAGIRRRRNRLSCNGMAPPSTRERSSRLVTSSPRRSVCDNAIRMVSASGSATPSTTFSSTACRAVIGVRSSWETLRDEPAPVLVGGAEIGGHLVERRCQLPDFVARGRAHPAAVVAARHGAGGGRHLPQRGRHAVREELGEDQRRRPRRPAARSGTASWHRPRR